MATNSPTDMLYEKAVDLLDGDQPEQALALVEQILEKAPDNAEAIVLKAEAFVLLDRWEEAEEFLMKSAQEHPREPRLLLAAADLVVDFYPDDPAAVEEAYEMAARGEDLAQDVGDPELLTELQRVQGRALTTLGESEGAVEAFERAYESSEQDDDVLVELAMAWFEALRFDDARKAFEGLKQRRPDDARVHHYLGLLAERTGRLDEAQADFDRATELNPEEFPKPITLSEAEFTAAVEAAFEKLPDRVQMYLANVPVLIDPVPTDEDLKGELPLSPLSLGMFRGLPIGEVSILDPWSIMPSSILLFQRNLERYARSREELIEEIETTLLHEVGHFVGWDEEDLFERGLH